MLLGLLGALVAALAYGSATILQALGVRGLRAAPVGSTLLQRARAGWLYAAGLGLDVVAFAASVGALRALPLFLVQSVIASSVAVTAVLAVVVLGARLTRREVAALAVVALGLVCLAASARDTPPHEPPSWLAPTLVVVAVLLAAVGVLAARRRASSVLAVIAGLGYGGVAIGARILPWNGSLVDALATWAMWALVLHAVIATVAYGFALDAGETTSVAAITFALETVAPSLVGLALLGDGVRPNTQVLAVAGFVLTLGACIALAGRSEAEA